MPVLSARKYCIDIISLPGVCENDNDSRECVTSFVFDNTLSNPSTPEAALKQFQMDIVEEDKPVQRISVCRMEGTAELRKDIIGVYKNSKTSLRAIPRVRFEEEDGVGSGPVREFLMNAVKIVEEGIPSSGKHLLFLEGERDHRVPVHDQSLRLTGAFKALGRIIGHSILHGGPGVYGLSPAIKSYFSTAEDDSDHQQPPPVVLEDVPDMELRQLISEVSSVLLYFCEKNHPLLPTIVHIIIIMTKWHKA